MVLHYHSLTNKGDILPHLWQRLLADDPPPWMWGNAGPLSLTEFICYFSDSTRHLFLVLTPDGQDCVGMAWLDDIAVGLRARAHFYFFAQYRAKKSSQIKETCHSLKTIAASPPFNLKLLLLFTDTRATAALRVAQRHLGATYFADAVPGYYPGEACVHIGYIVLKGESYAESVRTLSDGEHGDYGNGDARNDGPQCRGASPPPP